MQKKRFLRCAAAAFCALLMCTASAATRDELRAQWREISSLRTEVSVYASLPDTVGANAPGSLTDAAQDGALELLNFIRSLAGVDPVALDPLYQMRAQNAAYILAVNGEVSHAPAQPAAMADALYEAAYLGAQCSDVAMLPENDADALIDGIIYFARDDGENNLQTLSHRRWMLNPQMGATGFGLAPVQGGSTVAMYAVDNARSDASRAYVAWPSAGAFPVEFMRAGLAWSVSFDDAGCDLSAVHVQLTEMTTGQVFDFDPASGRGDGFCRVSTENYGSGACVIFRPDLASRGIAEYVQNQIWQVEVTGITSPLTYITEMISLYPQDAVNVEITPLEAAIRVGETLTLRAAVVPGYADDLRVTWTSDASGVASVDENGVVTAIAAGACRIRATTANGRYDECAVTVRK